MNRTAYNLFAISLSALTLAAALPAHAESADIGSDQAFNQLVGTWAARDGGSQAFDAYVEELNQEIAYRNATEPYGAAGPSGPLDSFNGYVNGFLAPDSGSQQFNNYVDAVNRVIQHKQSY